MAQRREFRDQWIPVISTISSSVRMQDKIKACPRDGSIKNHISPSDLDSFTTLIKGLRVCSGFKKSKVVQIKEFRDQWILDSRPSRPFRP